jgi:hypothetical protein
MQKVLVNENVNHPRKQVSKIQKIIDLLSFNKVLSPNHFPIVITSLYAVCVIIGMHYHELWRDELDVYAGFCYNSFQDYLGPQGHITFASLVYYGLMRLLLKLVPAFATYQAYHLIIVVAAVYVFNKYSSFNNLQKILFTFSYFMVFEYGIISRWYGFFVLLVFIITYLLTREKKNYILISILLIILANHTPSTTIFAASFSIYALIHIINRSKAKIISSEEKKKIIISLIILGTGALFIISENVYNVLKTGGNPFEAVGQPPFFMSLRTIWNSYVPIPDFSHGADFWNTNIFNFPTEYPKNYNINIFITPGNMFTAMMSFVFIVICLYIFSRKPPVLITFIINTALYFAFIHYIFRPHYIRHLGLLFIIFVYCAWLCKYSDDYINLPGFKFSRTIGGFSESKLVKILFTSFITIIFFFQFLAGALTYHKSIKYQFTKSWDTAKYIKSHNFDDYILIGELDYAVQPIAAILNRDIFFPQTNTFRKSMNWFNRDISLNVTKLFKYSIHYLNTYNRKILLILNFELIDRNGIPLKHIIFPNNILLRKLVNFKGEVIQKDEQYYLYEIIKTG